ncbi:DUF6160 family protein [Marinobacter mangrovi]|uniref:DUF6160 family protein n=1 Tax=Marinobacter mangrovi TaxID=2803918 RepID=UPI001932B07D|nr:DUF6160 family protein [Marinobacter mangrovi]
MKGLKKLVLATAVAAAPFAAHAELKALDDGAMGNVTGQAGVTIELETKVDIGEVRYQDEGTFAMTGVSIGGGSIVDDGNGGITTDGLLDDLKIDIDVEADGDAVIHVGNVNGQVPIDFAVAVNEVSLRGDTDSTLLASNIGIVGNLGKLDITVDTATDSLITDVAFNITNMDMDVDFLGVNVRGMQVMGGQFFEQVEASGQPTDAAGMFAAATLTIAKTTAAGSTSGEALGINVSDFTTDINVAETNIGGANIGTIQLDNLTISNTSMKVYGHN